MSVRSYWKNGDGFKLKYCAGTCEGMCLSMQDFECGQITGLSFKHVPVQANLRHLGLNCYRKALFKFRKLSLNKVFSSLDVISHTLLVPSFLNFFHQCHGVKRFGNHTNRPKIEIALHFIWLNLSRHEDNGGIPVSL
jgi:hypothetical protein